MYRPLPPVIAFPAFSCCWGKHEGEAAVVFAGGGGSAKTGVGNQIVITKVKKSFGPGGQTDKPLHLQQAFTVDTSPDVCAVVVMNEAGTLLAAAFDASVRIYAVGASSLALLATFTADFSKKGACVNCLAFDPRPPNASEGEGRSQSHHCVLTTGGEDGTAFSWALTIGEDVLLRACSEAEPVIPDVPTMVEGFTVGENGEKVKVMKPRKGPILPVPSDRADSKLLTVKQLIKFQPHSGPLTTVKYLPHNYVLLTASKDGACRLSNADTGESLADMSVASAMRDALNNQSSPPPFTGNPADLSCRACAVAPSEDVIYTAQAGKRGAAYVTVWKVQVEATSAGATQDDRGGGGGGVIIQATTEPYKTVKVAENPVTQMSLRADGHRLAVASTDGWVLIFELPSFRRVYKFEAHGLPVTGLHFASREVRACLLAGQSSTVSGTGTEATAQGSAARSDGGGGGGGDDGGGDGDVYDLVSCSADSSAAFMPSEGTALGRMVARAVDTTVAFLQSVPLLLSFLWTCFGYAAFIALVAIAVLLLWTYLFYLPSEPENAIVH